MGWLNKYKKLQNGDTVTDERVNMRFTKDNIPDLQRRVMDRPVDNLEPLEEMIVPNEPMSQEQPVGITPELLLKQAYKESTFNPKAVSPAGYKGLTQIGDAVIQDFNRAVDKNRKIDPFNPKDAIDVQKYSMNELYNASFNQKPQDDNVRVAKTLAAYNWGRGNLVKFLNRQKKKGIDIYKSLDWTEDLPKETRDYIQKILLDQDETFKNDFNSAIANPKNKQFLDLYGTNKRNGGKVPKAQAGRNVKPLYVDDADDPRYKSYQDSLYLHNFGNRLEGAYRKAAGDDVVPVNPKSVRYSKIKEMIKPEDLMDNWKDTDTEKLASLKPLLDEFHQKGNKSIKPVDFNPYMSDPDHMAKDLITGRAFMNMFGAFERAPGARIPQWKKPQQEVVVQQREPTYQDSLDAYNIGERNKQRIINTEDDILNKWKVEKNPDGTYKHEEDLDVPVGAQEVYDKYGIVADSIYSKDNRPLNERGKNDPNWEFEGVATFKKPKGQVKEKEEIVKPPNLDTDVVAYLQSQGQPHSYSERKKMFKERFPDEEYKGNADQNIKLLQSIKSGNTPEPTSQPNSSPKSDVPQGRVQYGYRNKSGEFKRYDLTQDSKSRKAFEEAKKKPGFRIINQEDLTSQSGKLKNGGWLKKYQNGDSIESDEKTIMGVHPDTGDLVTSLPEMTIFSKGGDYPYYDNLSEQEIEHFDEDGPIGRAVRAKATSGRTPNADDALNMGSQLLQGAGSALQAPQSAMVEGVEAMRGESYDFRNALPGNNQRVPSDAWGYENPEGFWQHAENFAMDVIADPFNVLGAGLITKANSSRGIANKLVKRRINQQQNNPLALGPAQSQQTAPWKLEELPGLHLQSTMSTNPKGLHTQVSKDGKIHVENALNFITKESGGKEKVEIIKQTLGDNLPQKMDYNEFRRKVNESLIPLEHNIANHKSDYGIERLGYNTYAREEVVDGRWVNVAEDKPLENKSIILGNKYKFGRGSSEHNNPEETLGHLHFLRDAESPDVLTVTQIQSDAFQGRHGIMPKTFNKERELKSLSMMENKLSKDKEYYANSKLLDKYPGDVPKHMQDTEKWYQGPDGQIMSEEVYLKGTKVQEQFNLMKKAEIENFAQKQLLSKNHQERYLQEVVNYASTRGDINKIRLPSQETAAKIQNYKKAKIEDNSLLSEDEFNEFNNLVKKYQEIPHNVSDADWDNIYQPIQKRLDELNLKREKEINYTPEHKTILKKYKDNPKLIKKLFGEEPKLIKDSKGNEWYEFDIPKNFKEGKGEIKAFKTGGWLSKYQNGGVIEDDRGQWAHPGKVTKINSNKITMKDVPYDVLGISNTGDRKLMKPDEEYEFEGSSVTEYPILKNGKNLAKRGQLTNFTNRNAQKGWLSKYQ